MEAIFEQQYWRERIAKAVDREKMHHAVYECPTEKWLKIREQHRRILARHIMEYTSILDVGCGWGRLLGMLPSGWKGSYTGVDICDDFISLARRAHPSRCFTRRDVRNGLDGLGVFDLAVLISIRPMVIREKGCDEWQKIHDVVRAHSKKQLYLEYDEAAEGELE